MQVGMKLEACDRQNKSLVCVASVANVLGVSTEQPFGLSYVLYSQIFYYMIRLLRHYKPVYWLSKRLLYLLRYGF
jgi:hypothetical protein